MKKIDVEIIGEGLKDNHTIYGIHLNGNQGYADNFGFVKPGNEEFSSALTMTKIATSLKSGSIKDLKRIQL
jgi:hypothetical protein